MAYATNMSDFLNLVNNKREQLTSLQFREFTPTLKGTKIDWNSEIQNVSHKGGVYVVNLKNTPNTIHFNYYITSKESALKLNKGKWYILSGEIKSCNPDPYFDTSCDVNIISFKSNSNP